MMPTAGNGGRAAADRSNRLGAEGGKPLVFALVLGLATMGCSFIWVTRPSPKKEASEFTVPRSCTSSYVMPGLDTAAAALFVAAFANVTLNPSSSSSTTSRETAIALDGTLGTAALLSTIYGYYYVAKCRRQMLAEINEPVLAQPAARSWSPPPSPSPAPAPPTIQVRGKRLAVLEFHGGHLDPDVLATFSDTVRGGALEGVEPHGMLVMTRENMLMLMRNVGKQECGEGDCEVETARDIGADYVITGEVVRIEQLYVVTLKLHETKGGSLLDSEMVEGASQVELLGTLREHARHLTATAFGPPPDSH